MSEVLKNELAADPQGFGFAALIAEGASGKIAEILNAPRYDTVGKVPIEDYVGYLIDSGKFAPMIGAASAGDALAAGLVGQLRIAKELGIRNVDMGSPVVRGQHQMLVDATFIDATDLANIDQLATHKISRAAQLGLGTVTAEDINQAFKG